MHLAYTHNMAIGGLPLIEPIPEPAQPADGHVVGVGEVHHREHRLVDAPGPVLKPVDGLVHKAVLAVMHLAYTHNMAIGGLPLIEPIPEPAQPGCFHFLSASLFVAMSAGWAGSGMGSMSGRPPMATPGGAEGVGGRRVRGHRHAPGVRGHQLASGPALAHHCCFHFLSASLFVAMSAGWAGSGMGSMSGRPPMAMLWV
jgi:hypothetical protein